MDQHKLSEAKGIISHDWSAIWSTPAWIAVACVVIAALVGWVALQAETPLERMQITYALVAAVFALAAVVLYSPGAAAILSGACLLIGVFNFWMALNSKGAESAA